MQRACKSDDLYKDVIVIGNGPSGICLSYMLAGNWPYYNGEPHPGDEMLTARLRHSIETKTRNRTDDRNARGSGHHKYQNREKEVNLVHCTREDLEFLSLGLEGRGTRPLSRLMDQLQHPCTDAGLDLPSLLTWKSPKECPDHRIIDHVVLGRGPPGGAWHKLDPNVLTISLSRWMSLPGLDLRHWEILVEAEKQRTIFDSRVDALSPLQEKISTCKSATRVPIGDVAEYYKDYVTIQGLKKYFRCGTTITSVRPNPDLNDNEKGYGWLVQGFENENGRIFQYRAKKVILATGTTDSLNRLGIPGEKSHSDWVIHDLNTLESKLDQLVSSKNFCSVIGKKKTKTEHSVDPVLVVGAGLSAADAIMATRFRGIPVLHIYRDSPNDWDKEKFNSNGYDRLKWLPLSIYPEYHKVYEMMSDGGTNYPLYKSLPGYTLVKVNTETDRDSHLRENIVTLSAPDGKLFSHRVSLAAILIGSKPDLSYLPDGGIGLGKFKDRPIDSRGNPIEIDDFTYEILDSPKRGLYALGPLVGDNFVRFTFGGALAILIHINSTLD